MLRLPANLVRSARSDVTPERREWLAALPQTVRELEQRWCLRVGEAFEPGGQCAWVAPVRDAAGRELVLKVGWRHDEAEHESDGLRAWGGRGVVHLHGAERFGETNALLLERCRPGAALGTLASEARQDVVIAGLLRRLWSVPAAGPPFRSLQTMCDAWAARFEGRLVAAPGALDPGLARAGMELWRGLPATAERTVLLATDLHAGNVLSAEREPWLVIDPKPYLGDPAYDVLQHLLNCTERLAADPLGLTQRLADLLELDRERVVRWLFARCVQESLDEPSLRAIAVALSPT